MRVVLDANVLVSAVISRAGPPREIVTRLGRGALRAGRKPGAARGASRSARPAEVPALGEPRDRDRAHRRTRAGRGDRHRPARTPGAYSGSDDDYLIAPARVARADYLVSGDRHLLDLDDPIPPVLTPRRFLDLLGV